VRKTAIIFSLLVVLGTACGGNLPFEDEPAGGGNSSSSGSPPEAEIEGPEFERATGRLIGDGAQVRLDLEVAETPEQRAFGLMFRESLPPDAGMVFLFPGATTGGFFMKNTLIPLSIAFFDQDGEILAIIDMTPCRREPCKIYEPGVAYTGALEVNEGSFARWDISIGDHFEISKEASSP
jgi:uncharacterized protein